jgi:(2Fe-2S) ferredoxin
MSNLSNFAVVGGLTAVALGATLWRRRFASDQQTSQTQQQTTSSSQPQPLTLSKSSTVSVDDVDDLLDSALSKVLNSSAFSSSSLKYVHDLYDVQEEYSDQCECEFGFKRPDFKKGDMVGRVSYHDKHFFILTRQKANEWDKDLGKQGFSVVLKKALSKNLKGVRCKISHAEAVDGESVGDETNNFSVLVFPDMIRYTNVNADNVEQVVNDVANKNVLNTTFKKEKLEGAQIFICAHANKDMRCGICGPRLYQSFIEKLPQSSYADKPVAIRRVSHIGGHKFAGNLIIYQYSNKTRKVFGDWYGYVDENDVDRLIQEHLVKNNIVTDIWRGRCGLKQELAEKFLQFQSN